MHYGYSPFPAGAILGWTIRWLYARFQLAAAEQKAERIKRDAVKEAESQKKEILVEAKDQLIRERNQQEREIRERRAELQRYERRVQQKEETLDKKIETLDRQEQTLQARIKAASDKEEALAGQEERYRLELERISGLSAEEAKKLIIQGLENEAKRDAQIIINKIEQEASLSAERRSRDILVTTIQRIATEVTTEVTVTSVSLPSDEMKGRIIGREGRNIRTLETLTGVDVIIDDTPEAVVISCFDPVRREIARVSLERLIADGRIHPGPNRGDRPEGHARDRPENLRGRREGRLRHRICTTWRRSSSSSGPTALPHELRPERAGALEGSRSHRGHARRRDRRQPRDSQARRAAPRYRQGHRDETATRTTPR